MQTFVKNIENIIYFLVFLIFLGSLPFDVHLMSVFIPYFKIFNFVYIIVFLMRIA